MWHELAWPTLRNPEIASEVEALRESTLRFLLWITAIGYLGWHIVSTDRASPDSLERHWVLVPLVLLGLLTTFSLQRSHPRRAVVAFVGFGALSIVAGAWLLSSQPATLLFPLLALAAVILLQPLAGIVVGLASTALLLALQAAGPLAFLTPSQVTEVAVLSGLTVAIAWGLSRSMIVAVEWSLNSYALAARSMQDARDQRAELVQTLKQLDGAYYQLERANAALVLAWKAAEAAERSKSEFVTNISHELRTPLNLIVGFSEAIMTSPESYDVPLPPAYRGDLNAVYRSAQHLLTLTNDVIDLARVGMDRLALAREPVALGEIVEDAGAIVREYIQAKKLWLRLEVQPDVPILELDRLRVRQIMLNLLTNAARFTERGGITVSASRDEGWVVVKVTDTGRGIAPDELGKVFDQFHHTDPGNARSARASGGGYGLGLPISKRLIELHGGRIGVESVVGVGTTFWFALPTVTSEGGTGGDSWHPLRMAGLARTQERILVLAGADDRFARFLQRHLQTTRVVAAADLPRAITTSVELRATAILADRCATDLDLVETPVPICAVSLPRGERLAAALGVAGYLVKPVNRLDLGNAIRELDQPVHRVLIVDDDPRFVRLMARLLKGLPGHPKREILRAHNGAEALVLMDEKPPDLVLLDLVMPELGGLEVVSAMARSPRLAKVPVIIVSAQDQVEGQVALDGLLSIKKPDGFRLEELLRAIEAILGALDPPHRYLTAVASGHSVA
ncbi:MAG: ATP-binding response regulator [Chloroflexota bacterium]